jgi:hypothetical protein
MKQTGKPTRKPQMGLTFEDVWAMFQETHRQIGELGNKFGAVVEHMMIPNLKEKFNALGYEFGKVSTNVLIETKEEGTIAEIDIFLENGDCAMTEGIKNQCKRMERLRKYSDKRNDRRKLYGAMAGAIFRDNAKRYALKQGLYLIEQSGDTVRIIEPSGENTAKAW